MFPELYEIERRDLPVLGEKMGRAFEADPVCHYIFPDEKTRRERARHFYEFVLRTSFLRGRVFAPSGELEAVACWLPPDRVHVNTWQYILAGAVKTMWRTGPRAFARIDYVGAVLDKRHHKYAPEPHYYLACLGTAPEHWKKGFAGKLMRPMLEHCDREGLGIYLDTHNSVNPGLYERYGFETVDKSPIPKTDLVQWSMLRRPRGGK